MTDSVHLERRGPVLAITLDRPQARNSVDLATARALGAALELLASEDDLRVAVLRSTPPVFCAGQDLNDRAVAPGEAVDLGESVELRYNPLIRNLVNLPMPVIARVNGVAAGAGANIALACDIVIAAKSAKFIQGFAAIGVIPDSGGTWVLPRLVGQARALGLALTGEPLPADKAEAWGLIWRMVEDLELMAQAHRLCVHFSEAPTVALALIKRLLDESWSNDLDSQLDLERETQREASLTPDYTEGVRAFLEKRAPAFSGRRGG